LAHTNSTIQLPDIPPPDRTRPRTLHNRRPAPLTQLRTRLTRTRPNRTTVALIRPIRQPSRRTTEVNLASRPPLNTTVITLPALHSTVNTRPPPLHTTVTTRPPHRPSLRTHRCLLLINNNRYSTHRRSITVVQPANSTASPNSTSPNSNTRPNSTNRSTQTRRPPPSPLPPPLMPSNLQPRGNKNDYDHHHGYPATGLLTYYFPT